MAAVFTLFLTPAFYVLMARLVRPRNDAQLRLEREMEAARRVLAPKEDRKALPAAAE
jgi:hypothetical protein